MSDIYLAGRNADYDLGLGDATQRNTHAQLTGDWLVVRTNSSTSGKFGLGIKTDGTLWAWGDNTYKQLGLASASYTTPTQVGSATNWVDIAAGAYHTLALKADGTLWATGQNTTGQCGQGNTTSPVNGFTQVGSLTTWAGLAAGGACSFAWRTDGSLWACGQNSGQLGIGTTSSYEHTFTREATSSSLWAEVKTNLSFCLARRTDGTLWSWGIDSYGETAQGATGTYATPVQIGSSTDWTAIAAGTNTTYAIKSGGTLWAAGRGQYYALGTGNTSNQTSLVQIGSATDWAAVAAGNQFMLALKTSGIPSVVGRNVFGVLGTGGTSDVTSLTAIAPAYSVTDMDAGGNASILYGAPPPSTAVTAPITITVTHKSGTASAPIRVNVRQSGTASAPLAISVVDSLVTTAWTARVTLAGSDVSGRLTGELSVDAEEGAARIARFSMLPAAGAINPIAWTGSAVIIDLMRVIGGVSVPSRLFTGVVDIASYDPQTRLVRFDCTDDLQHTVAALTTDQIDALTGGHYSIGVQGRIDDRWDYAQARMESRQASLDAGPHGNLRVTDWDGLATWRTFTAADILDASPAIELPRRQDIINQVEIAYEYRYHRLRERQASVGWSGSILGSAPAAAGYPFPTAAAVESAISGVGWHVLSQTYNPAYAYVKVSKPSGAPSGADTDWWIYNGGGGISNYTARLCQRHAQTVTESYALTVTAPASITANGTLIASLRGTLASDWTPDAWETDYSLPPDVTAADQDYAPDATRADSDAAIETLHALAKTRILASHRQARASFSIPCLPELDLVHAVEIDTATLDATGKLVRLVHSLDFSSGEATTRATLALSGIAAGGIVSETPATAPTAPDIDAATGDDLWQLDLPDLASLWVGATDAITHTYTDDLMGFLVNAPETATYFNFTLGVWYSVSNGDYNAAKAYPATGFRCRMPGVADSHRNPLTLPAAADYLVDIPQDPLTLTA